jgi:hypothetical protein
LINTSVPGNNVLNSNLSGSFREKSNDDDDDDPILDGRVAVSAPRVYRSAPNIMQHDQPGTSSDSQNASPQRLGVAAISNRNIQFLTRALNRNDF